MEDNIFADLFIFFAAWVGLTFMFFYLAEWVRVRFRQNKLHNELRYPRRHKEQ
jgi:choline-glycine betaine transporter